MVLAVKNLPANAGDVRNVGFTPGSRKIPWRKACQPTPVFLPEESRGQTSLVGYNPQGRKESDMTEQLHFTHRSNNMDRKPINLLFMKKLIF